MECLKSFISNIWFAFTIKDELAYFIYLLLFTNLVSEMPLFNKAFFCVVIEIGSSPTRFLKYFLSSKFFIAINFLIRHIYKDIQRAGIVQMN